MQVADRTVAWAVQHTSVMGEPKKKVPISEPAYLGRVFLSCVEESSDAIMLTDTRGEIIYVNPAWERLYGFTGEEALGSTPRLLRSGRHDGAFYRRMWQDILDPAKGFWKGEVINVGKSGVEIPVQLTISPFRNGLGSVQGYMSIGIDITEKKKLEAQILRQDRLASIGLLAAGLAHEIGTPLGVVRGRAEYLIASANLPTESRSSLEVIVTQIDRVSSLVYSLLNLAGKGGGTDARPVALAATLSDVSRLLRQRLLDSEIRLVFDVPPQAAVLAEPTRLQQVFLTLLMNAIHAIEARGPREKGAENCIRIGAAPHDDQWEISVEDTGSGITPENMAHLFKPFFTTKDVGMGTGLGLAIAHQIIHGWNGSIWAESPPGRGATFLFRLPRSTNQK